MRRILSLLCEYRRERLSANGADNGRLAEVNDFYGNFDNLLSGITPTETGNQLEEVMMTADFSNAFGDFVQRKVIPGYKQKRFDFELFMKPEETPNYQTVNRKQNRAGVDDLEWVSDKGEARPGSVTDAVEREFKVEAWKKQFDFSMRNLINDDIGYFSDHALKMGISARRTQEKFVSRMLFNATGTGWLTAAAQLPLYSTTGRLTSSRVATARMMFNQRVDTRGEPIAVALRYLVHHPGLVDTVRVIRQSQLIPELATNAVNVIRGDFIPIEDPYVAGIAPAPYLNLPWYAMCDWRTENVVPFILARRAGFPAPILVRKQGNIESFSSFEAAGTLLPPIFGDFQTNNVTVMVWDEWGTYIDATYGNMFDVRGSYYSSGTAA